MTLHSYASHPVVYATDTYIYIRRSQQFHTDRLKLSIKSVSSIKMLYFATCFGYLRPSSGVYKQQNASTCITRLRNSNT
jgi:hypothetical protein